MKCQHKHPKFSEYYWHTGNSFRQGKENWHTGNSFRQGKEEYTFIHVHIEFHIHRRNCHY